MTKRVLHAMLLILCSMVVWGCQSQTISGNKEPFAVGVHTSGTNTKVWFGPNIGSSDMVNLFTDPEQWATVRSRIDVFKFYSWHLVQVDTGGLVHQNTLTNFVNAQAFSKLTQWGIDIGFEANTSQLAYVHYDTTDCGSRTFIVQESVAMANNAISAVEANGGSVSYISLDEPFMKGNYLNQTGEPGESGELPCYNGMGEVAEDVAAIMAQIQATHPSILIGDMEPYPVWSIDQLQEWLIALEAAGASLDFFEFDISMGRVVTSHDPPIDLEADLISMKSFLESRNIAFAVTLADNTWDNLLGKDSTGQLIYNADYTAQDYYENALEFVCLIKSIVGEPDYSVFQSWRESWADPGYGLPFVRQLPHNLSETDPYSHTHLIDAGLDVLRNENSDGLPTDCSEAMLK